MDESADLEVKSYDFLKDNPRLYAHKARRKKIAVIRVDAVNLDSADVTVILADSKLLADGRSYNVEARSVLIRVRKKAFS